MWLMIWPCSPPCIAGVPAAFSFSAVAGLTSTALSHVSLVIGLGSSCSQPLFAKRPSRIDGSLRKETSRPEAAGAGVAAGVAVRLKPGATETDLGANAVSGITPSWTQRRQERSNASVGGVPLEPGCARLEPDQCSRTMSYAERSGRSVIAAISSWADLLS